MSAPGEEVARIVARGAPLMLDIGCGPRKRGADWIGIDRDAHPGVDLVGDALGMLAQFPDGSIDRVFTSHFLEHLEGVEAFVALLSAKLKPGSEAEIVVPHFSNPYFYSDPTHRTPFGLYTFCYFAQCDLFARQVPAYARKPGLRLDAVTLGFKAAKPFYVRYAMRRAFGAVVNLAAFTQELYEDSLAWIVPCYEVRYRLTRVA